MPTSISSLPQSFVKKKAQILSDLSIDVEKYTDKSPKGSVDSQIQDLIDEVNSYEGLVTTSSCAGRVAIFVEGGRQQRGEREEEDGEDREESRDSKPMITTGPGGKGGGKWLFVSHDPISHMDTNEQNGFMELFGLDHPGAAHRGIENPTSRSISPLRLIHLTFSPFILHVLCASLQHARPLLAAAINSGFRESGVQSLKALDDTEIGTMVAIRTAGITFETIVGVYEDGMVGEKETPRALVSEEYLRMCVEVINERFEWNDKRRNRFRKELREAIRREEIVGENGWEDAEVRKRRKREEGLRLRQQKEKTKSAPKRSRQSNETEDEDALDSGLGTLEIG